ncbi:MAG: S1/P1 Nuclease [Verrucomicrobia bacterium]|nr:S1/P1 Nuclease [Cytophagales bacterium]
MRKNVTVLLFILFCGILGIKNAGAWGFFGHQRINRLAVFSLPSEMIGFYKYNLLYVTENAVSPDRRRYAVQGEAPKHYIDMDIYGDSAWYKLPHRWDKAVEQYTEDTLMAYGIVPWHINLMKFQLTEAFRQRSMLRILRLSADLGHYIGDANVPLHTTENYNGQRTNQIGIHGFWESRLVELFSDDYDFFVGKATYVKNPQERAWLAVKYANAALDSVLRFERELSARFPEDKKYAFEQRGGITVKVHSKEYAKAYHQLLSGQVERQMKSAIKMIADFWFTCWVDAGQPDLKPLVGKRLSNEEMKTVEEEKNEMLQQHVPSRPHESSFLRDEPIWEEKCCQPYFAVSPATLRKRFKPEIKQLIIK